ncbi:hypothetical protein JW710_02485 [Candidatus Dojkabacteria bacterium]|nr:hypothetical protein [Candidatus Dojkabacteria bacterium]
MPQKKSKKKKTKVPASSSKVTVIKLHCPNCGVEEERVIYCESCDSPMDFDSVEERETEEVENDVAVSKDVANASDDSGDDSAQAAGDDSTVVDDEMEKIINEEGLGDIFPGSSEMDEDTEESGPDGDMDLSDVLDVLDNE